MNTEEAIAVVSARPDTEAIVQIDADWFAHSCTLSTGTRCIMVESTTLNRSCGIAYVPDRGPNLLNYPPHVARWLRKNINFETMRFSAHATAA